MNTCEARNCTKASHAKGLCRAHYLRQYRHGSTTPLQGGTLEERFWRSVDRRGPDECWLWTGSAPRYGIVSVPGGTKMGAHRASYILHHGPIPPGMYVLHKCDTPLCVNPAHLRAGTPKENTADMDAKGRRVIAYCKGEKSHLSVLNEHSVRFIRSSELRTADLARIFNLTDNAIRAVRIRKSWKHVA